MSIGESLSSPGAKAASLAIAVGYVVWAYAENGGEGVFDVLVGLPLPLACIWFGEYLSYYRGWASFRLVTQESSGTLLCLAGWALLLLPWFVWVLRSIGAI